MKAIEIMNEEHKYILRMLSVVRKCCFKILQGEENIYEDFDDPFKGDVILSNKEKYLN